MGLTRLKGLERLDGLGRRDYPDLEGLGEDQEDQELPELTTEEVEFDLEDAELDRLINALGDVSLAKRVRKLQGEFPVGSVPELVAYNWLKANRKQFQYQAVAFGGRARRGGLVPDFVIDMGGWAQVWMVQGLYWHTRPGVEQKDEASRLRLKGTYIGGLRVKQVIFLHESRIMGRQRDDVFRKAMAGLELPP